MRAPKTIDVRVLADAMVKAAQDLGFVVVQADGQWRQQLSPARRVARGREGASSRAPEQPTWHDSSKERSDMKTRPEPGTRVRLTGDFLRSTGQFAGGEGQSKWTVVDCDCDMCKRSDRQFSVVAVNQPHIAQTDPTGYEDLKPEDRPKWRHINVANLEKCK